MARPRADVEQKIKALELFRRRYDPVQLVIAPKAAHKYLQTNFDVPVSLRTVQNWYKEFREAELRITADSPFDWRDMGLYEIPFDASDYILRIWRQAKGWWPHLDEDPTVRVPVTGREMRWVWRVHQACRELSDYDTYWIARRFLHRDIADEVLHEDLGVEDLQAYIAYRPWEGPSQLSAFKDAAASGNIPPLPDLMLHEDSMRIKNEASKEVLGLTLARMSLVPDFLLMLPSQQMDFIRKEYINTNPSFAQR